MNSIPTSVSIDSILDIAASAASLMRKPDATLCYRSFAIDFTFQGGHISSAPTVEVLLDRAKPCKDRDQLRVTAIQMQ